MELHGIIYTEKFNKDNSISNIFSDRSVKQDNSYTINENFTKFKVKGCYVTLCTSGYLDIIDVKSYIVEYESFAKFSINTENQTLLYSFFQGKSLKKHIYIKSGEIVESFGEIKSEIESCKELFDSLLIDDFIIRLYDLNVDNLKNNLPQSYFPTKKTNSYKWIVRAFYFLYAPRIISFLILTPFALIVLFKLLFFSPFSCEKYNGVIDKAYKIDSTIVFQIDNQKFYAKHFDSLSINEEMNVKVWYLNIENKNRVYKLMENDTVIIPFDANYDRNILRLILSIILFSIVPSLLVYLFIKETNNLYRIRKYVLKRTH